MRKKSFCLALCATLLALCSPTGAQQKEKVFRIGFLEPSTSTGTAVMVDAFRQEMKKLGWIEGKNIIIEYRFAENKGLDRLSALATELVQLKVNVIVATAEGGPGPLNNRQKQFRSF